MDRRGGQALEQRAKAAAGGQGLDRFTKLVRARLTKDRKAKALELFDDRRVIETLLRIAPGLGNLGTEGFAVLGRQHHAGKTSFGKGVVEVLGLGDLHQARQPSDLRVCQALVKNVLHLDPAARKRYGDGEGKRILCLLRRAPS